MTEAEDVGSALAAQEFDGRIGPGRRALAGTGENVAILGQRLRQPAQNPERPLAFLDKGPDKNEFAVAIAGDDRKLGARSGRDVGLGPGADPVIGLENLVRPEMVFLQAPPSGLKPGQGLKGGQDAESSPMGRAASRLFSPRPGYGSDWPNLWLACERESWACGGKRKQNPCQSCASRRGWPLRLG